MNTQKEAPLLEGAKCTRVQKEDCNNAKVRKSSDVDKQKPYNDNISMIRFCRVDAETLLKVLKAGTCEMRRLLREKSTKKYIADGFRSTLKYSTILCNNLESIVRTTPYCLLPCYEIILLSTAFVARVAQQVLSNDVETFVFSAQLENYMNRVLEETEKAEEEPSIFIFTRSHVQLHNFFGMQVATVDLCNSIAEVEGGPKK